MLNRILAGLALLAISSTAFSATVSGDLGAGDATWDGCGAAGATCFYDVYSFTVSTDGVYDMTAFYPGDVPSDANMDGYLRLFEGSFDPANAGASIATGDDYNDGGVCEGQNCSNIMESLTAGTQYFIAVTTFTDVANSFGTPDGPYELTIDGPGAVTIDGAVVPIPAAVWLFASGLFGLGALRRRS